MAHEICLLNPPSPGSLFADQVVKFGAWATGSLVSNFLLMDMGQQLFPHKLEAADQIYVVLDGEAEFHSYDNETIGANSLYRPEAARKVDPAPKTSGLKPDQLMKARTGDVIAIPRNTFHSIANCGEARLTLLAVGSPVLDRAVYTSR